MAVIDNIVDVSISRQTAQLDLEVFDVPLILVEMDAATATSFGGRVKTYTSYEALEDDLPIGHAGLVIAGKLLGGQQKPNTFKVGRKDENESYAEALSAVIDADDRWIALLSDAEESSDIMQISESIQRMQKVYFFSTDSAEALQADQNIEYTATVRFDISGAEEGDTLTIRLAGQQYTSTLAEEGWTDFLGGTVAIDSEVSPAGLATITSVENFVITRAEQEIQNGYSGPVDPENISATDPVGADIGQRIKAKGLFKTVYMYSPTAFSEYPEASWVGSQIVEVPGSNTWEYKSLAGVTPARLTDSQVALLESRNYNYYITVKGVPVTRRGVAADSEWVDTIILVMWLEARMQEQIFFRLANARKIPYTGAGFTVIEGDIRSVLSQAQANGGVDSFTVSSPNPLDIPEIQRGKREAGIFRFQARLAGAISTVVVRGVVNY